MDGFTFPELSWTLLPAFLFVISVIIFIHEMGHFLVARWCGVAVETFSLGFGKELFSFSDKKGTKWRVALLPLGGYVKFAGDANGASQPDPDVLAGMSEEEKASSFALKPLYQRAAIVAAGPIANFLLSIVIFSFFFYFYGVRDMIPEVSKVVEGSPAEQAGLIQGDIITHVNGQEIQGFYELRRHVMLSGGEALSLQVKRNESTEMLSLVPKQVVIDDSFGTKQTVWQVGVQSVRSEENSIYRTFGLFPSLQKGVEQTWQIITDTLSFIGQMFVGKQSTDQLSGPVGIANMVQHLGFTQIVYMIAVLSVSIGLINLFPIPVLDGGHLIFYLIEGLRGRPLSERMQEYSFRAGFFIIIAFMIFVFHIDLVKIFGI